MLKEEPDLEVVRRARDVLSKRWAAVGRDRDAAYAAYTSLEEQDKGLKVAVEALDDAIERMNAARDG